MHHALVHAVVLELGIDGGPQLLVCLQPTQCAFATQSTIGTHVKLSLLHYACLQSSSRWMWNTGARWPTPLVLGIRLYDKQVRRIMYHEMIVFGTIQIWILVPPFMWLCAFRWLCASVLYTELHECSHLWYAHASHTYLHTSAAPPKVWTYQQAMEIDSAFFYSGLPWDMVSIHCSISVTRETARRTVFKRCFE